MITLNPKTITKQYYRAITARRAIKKSLKKIFPDYVFSSNSQHSNSNIGRTIKTKVINFKFNYLISQSGVLIYKPKKSNKVDLKNISTKNSLTKVDYKGPPILNLQSIWTMEYNKFSDPARAKQRKDISNLITLRKVFTRKFNKGKGR